ncbi:MAG: DNA ligase [Gammaproteobacteria bacterium]|nr:DNA ligase [Gammaproteobacteria bacterium]
MRFFSFFVLCFILLFSPYISASGSVPALLLAKLYKQNNQLADYWVSEKLDGVRAYWNGKNFISRQGNIIQAPDWFIEVLPNIKLDGELWISRAQFEVLSGRVRKKSPIDKEWREIKYMIFDLPESKEIFTQRLKQLEKIISNINAEHIQLIKQFKVSSHQVLMKKLDKLVKLKAEGLMLHRGSSFYKSGRHDDLVKLKRYYDAEAIVIKHIEGKGKFKGMLGSILVETKNKIRFKIGSGFTNKERKSPPKIGTEITYKYFGLTRKGTPRFASYLRIRNQY